jgi:transketolase C-terminal domain/subunit
MQLIEVNSAATARDFIKVNVLLNKDNPNYIRALDNEVNDVFDASKNKAFKYGEIKRWILKDDNK